MPKLIMRDRQLGVVARQLVTDANGAPCCCGGVCCPAEAPCLPLPYRRCGAGGILVQDNCPPSRGYRMRVTSTWRSLYRFRQANVIIRDENGRQRLVNELVQTAQFALTATADYCVSSDPSDNAVHRQIPNTMRLEGATFQSVTTDGASFYEYAAAGEVLIATLGEGFDVARSDLLPVITDSGRGRPVQVALLFGNAGGMPIYSQGGVGGATISGTIEQSSVSRPTCTATIAWSRYTTEQYRWEDACTGGRFTWSTTTEALPASFPNVAVTDYTANLESTWTREFCPCGGGGPTELTGGGCTNCGDRSQLEVIE